MHNDKDPHIHDVNDGRIERAKDNALGKHDSNPDASDLVGEAAGGVSGVLAGAAIGSVAGPVGTVIGGIAGAMGGWWAGRAISEAAESLTDEDDAYYRRHYETSATRPADRTYDHARPAYHLGHIASRNPEYKGRSWEEVEPQIQRGWSDDVSRSHGSWDSMRSFAREGYARGTSTLGNAAARTASAVDNVKDRVDGNPASRPGPDATDSNLTARGGQLNANTADRLGAAADNTTDRLGAAADNVKDRVDGNPASRPGLDATDSRNIERGTDERF